MPNGRLTNWSLNPRGQRRKAPASIASIRRARPGAPLPRHEFSCDVAGRSAIADEASIEVDGRLAAYGDIKGFAVAAFEIEPQTKALPAERCCLSERQPSSATPGGTRPSGPGVSKDGSRCDEVRLGCRTHLDMTERVIHLPEQSEEASAKSWKRMRLSMISRWARTRSEISRTIQS